MNKDWSIIEVELIVADYFSMLNSELRDEVCNKSHHRKILLPLLSGRSEGSIEFKHQNISAVLIGMGLPFIKGYKPRFNFQKERLVSAIQSYLIGHREMENLFTRYADGDEEQLEKPSFENWRVEPPIVKNSEKRESIRKPIKLDYLEREQNNRNLGLLGEELALEYEKYFLIANGRANLADSVEWVSRDKGDGFGYDILSKNINGTDKYVEVKTTKLGKEMPFFFSSNEYHFSRKNHHNYQVSRIFNFGKAPKIFILNGSFDSFCKMEAVAYQASF